MRASLLTFLSLTLLAGDLFPQPAAERLPLDPAVRRGTLPNGLRYFIRRNTRPEKRAELRLVVNAGSILEDDDQRGLAHFVEHMAFNGTRHFEKQALVDYIEGIGMRFGAHLNASTSFDETIYQLLVPTDSADQFRRAFQILEDWAHGITFDTIEIRKERGVVIEEWRLGQGASSRMLRQQLPVLFRGSRYADRLPIGTKESLEQFDPAALRRYYRDWYRPDLMAVVAVGDFQPAAVERLIRRHFVGLRSAGPRRRPRIPVTVPPRDSTGIAIATDPEASSTTVGMYLFRPRRVDPTVAGYRRSLIAGLYSRMLNQRLDELTQRANPPFIGAGGGEGALVRTVETFSLAAAVADTGISRGLEAVLTEVERVRRHGFTAGEFDRAKRDFLRAYEQAYAEREKTESGQYAEEYIRHFLSREPIPGIAAEFALVKRLLPAIQIREVNQAADAWLSLRDRVLTVNAPAKPSVVVPSATELLGLVDRVRHIDVAAYQEELSEAPLVPPGLEPRAPVSRTTDSTLGVTRLVLDNGVRLLLKPTTFKADEVLFTAYSPGGNSLVPDSLFVSAMFAAQMVGVSGLGEFSAIDLQKKLSGKAVSVSPFIGAFQEGLSGRASPQDLETLFQLIYLHFTAPRRDPEAAQAFATNARAAVANWGANPMVAFRDTLVVTMAQHHPRSRPITSAIIDSLDLDRSLAVYRDRFADASDFTFVMVGTFSVDSVAALASRYLGNLPATRRGEKWRDIGLRAPRGVVTREVRRGIEPKSQTELVFTGPFSFARSDRFLLRSIAEILEIKLREVLREDLGGTYGVSVSPGANRIPEPEYNLSIRFGSAPDRVETLVAAIFAQIDTLTTIGPAEKDLAKVRETTIRTRETDLKENGFWLGQLAAVDQNGEDPSIILRQSEFLPLLTADRVRSAAAQYLDRGNYVRITLLPEGRSTP
ncbi:MAG: insulinase family protein [Gemmatimonadetes bacterium]|nr:insulinase family protein [Gemmatimonadota bacterium]